MTRSTGKGIGTREGKDQRLLLPRGLLIPSCSARWEEKAEWKPGASPGREVLATVSWGPGATSSEEGGLEVEQPSCRITAPVLMTQPVLV